MSSIISMVSMPWLSETVMRIAAMIAACPRVMRSRPMRPCSDSIE
jgi:hypothetical protein